MKTLKLAKELALPPDVVTQKINVLGQSGDGAGFVAGHALFMGEPL